MFHFTLINALLCWNGYRITVQWHTAGGSHHHYTLRHWASAVLQLLLPLANTLHWLKAADSFLYFVLVQNPPLFSVCAGPSFCLCLLTSAHSRNKWKHIIVNTTSALWNFCLLYVTPILWVSLTCRIFSFTLHTYWFKCFFWIVLAKSSYSSSYCRVSFNNFSVVNHILNGIY